MNVLSLFDGMSCGMIALDRLGIKVDNYYASEIDKYAIQVSQANYPDIVQLGDVTNWQEWDIDWATIDLVTGGFPCQSWSLAGKQLGDKDERGMLFWVMLDIMQKVMENNPNAYYLMENVKMKKEFEEYITMHTQNALPNVYKYFINSSLVSAQSRQRYYWTNIPNVEQPEERGIVLKDILEDQPSENPVKHTERNRRHLKQLDEKSLCMTATMYKGAGNNGMTLVPQKLVDVKAAAYRARSVDENGKRVAWKDAKPKQMLELRKDEKSNSVTSVQKDNVLTKDEVYWRKLSPLECMRLQTVQDDYLMPVSNTQKYKLLGNGWNIETICHILKNMEA